jgi:sulfofructose kinase
MILGFGENSVDLVYPLPRYPQPGSADSKVAIDRHDVRCGGQVATTLATCAALGLQTRYAGAFGNDAHGRLVRQELSGRGVDVSQALVREAPNRYAVILIDGRRGERVVLWEKDPRLAIAPGDVRREWLTRATWVHVDATDVDAAIALARLARAANVPVSCDVDADAPGARELIDAVTVPILAETLPHVMTGEADLEQALRALRRPHHRHVVVTLGARGSAMLTPDRFLTEGGVAVDAVDTTGAGDVFRGAFIAAITRGQHGSDALRFANVTAAASCTREGALDSVPRG